MTKTKKKESVGRMNELGIPIPLSLSNNQLLYHLKIKKTQIFKAMAVITIKGTICIVVMATTTAEAEEVNSVLMVMQDPIIIISSSETSLLIGHRPATIHQ